jgi:hypothetical protein
MGLYSRVFVALGHCTECDYAATRVVQFKYGDCRLREYGIGDELLWEANVVGEAGHEVVRVAGFAEPCPKCGRHSDQLDEVRVRDGRIEGVYAVGSFDQELAIFGHIGHRVEG